MDLAIIVIMVTVIAAATIMYLRHVIKKPGNEADRKFAEQVKKIRKKYGLGSS